MKQLSYLYSSLFFFSICSFPLYFFLTFCNNDTNTDEPVKRWNLFSSSQCSRTHNVRNKAAAFLYAAVFSQEEGIWWALKGLGTESKLKTSKSLTEKTQFLFHPGTELRKKVNAMRPQAVVFLIFLLQQSYNHFHPSLKVYNTLWLLFPMQWTVCTCSSDAVLEKSSLKTKLRFFKIWSYSSCNFTSEDAVFSFWLRVSMNASERQYW